MLKGKKAKKAKGPKGPGAKRPKGQNVKKSIGLKGNDVIFPELFYFPENREFLGIQSNFLGIPRNLLKATFSQYL